MSLDAPSFGQLPLEIRGRIVVAAEDINLRLVSREWNATMVRHRLDEQKWKRWKLQSYIRGDGIEEVRAAAVPHFFPRWSAWQQRSFSLLSAASLEEFGSKRGRPKGWHVLSRRLKIWSRDL